MTKKITHDVKETALEALKVHGTMQYASKICGVSVRTLNEEMRRSEVFKRRVLEARAEGKVNIADRAIELIKSYAYGEMDMVCIDCKGTGRQPISGIDAPCPICKGAGHVIMKTDRNRLTAAIALANAYEPGFRGQTIVQGRIDHDVRVITAVPRPKYDEIEAPKIKVLDKGIEEIIEGEVINE